MQFDMRVLKQHMDVQPYSVIDTFPLAQALIPFTPSYALEVLDKSLTAANSKNAKPATETTTAESSTKVTSHHDALYDAYATQRLFFGCIDRLTTIVKKYPEVMIYLSQSEAPLAKIIDTGSSEHILRTTTPILTKVYTSDKKLISESELDKDEFADKGKYFIGDKSLKSVLKALPKENVMYVFSQRHKTQLAKNLLHEIGLTHIDIG
ncbi:hypothetical protein KBC03_01445 [Patescibacteria group bacterium]|nr:hypothetical protein [Patescibacteria group bacterium]